MACIGGWVAKATMLLPNGQISVLDSEWMVVLSFFVFAICYESGFVFQMEIYVGEGQWPLGLVECHLWFAFLKEGCCDVKLGCMEFVFI